MPAHVSSNRRRAATGPKTVPRISLVSPRRRRSRQGAEEDGGSSVRRRSEKTREKRLERKNSRRDSARRRHDNRERLNPNGSSKYVRTGGYPITPRFNVRETTSRICEILQMEQGRKREGKLVARVDIPADVHDQAYASHVEALTLVKPNQPCAAGVGPRFATTGTRVVAFKSRDDARCFVEGITRRRLRVNEDFEWQSFDDENDPDDALIWATVLSEVEACRYREERKQDKKAKSQARKDAYYGWGDTRGMRQRLERSGEPLGKAGLFHNDECLRKLYDAFKVPEGNRWRNLQPSCEPPNNAGRHPWAKHMHKNKESVKGNGRGGAPPSNPARKSTKLKTSIAKGKFHTYSKRGNPAICKISHRTSTRKRGSSSGSGSNEHTSDGSRTTRGQSKPEPMIPDDRCYDEELQFEPWRPPRAEDEFTLLGKSGRLSRSSEAMGSTATVNLPREQNRKLNLHMDHMSHRKFGFSRNNENDSGSSGGSSRNRESSSSSNNGGFRTGRAKMAAMSDSRAAFRRCATSNNGSGNRSSSGTLSGDATSSTPRSMNVGPIQHDRRIMHESGLIIPLLDSLKRDNFGSEAVDDRNSQPYCSPDGCGPSEEDDLYFQETRQSRIDAHLLIPADYSPPPFVRVGTEPPSRAAPAHMGHINPVWASDYDGIDLWKLVELQKLEELERVEELESFEMLRTPPPRFPPASAAVHQYDNHRHFVHHPPEDFDESPNAASAIQTDAALAGQGRYHLNHLDHHIPSSVDPPLQAMSGRRPSRRLYRSMSAPTSKPRGSRTTRKNDGSRSRPSKPVTGKKHTHSLREVPRRDTQNAGTKAIYRHPNTVAKAPSERHTSRAQTTTQLGSAVASPRGKHRTTGNRLRSPRESVGSPTPPHSQRTPSSTSGSSNPLSPKIARSGSSRGSGSSWAALFRNGGENAQSPQGAVSPNTDAAGNAVVERRGGSHSVAPPSVATSTKTASSGKKQRSNTKAKKAGNGSASRSSQRHASFSPIKARGAF